MATSCWVSSTACLGAAAARGGVRVFPPLSAVCAVVGGSGGCRAGAALSTVAAELPPKVQGLVDGVLSGHRTSLSRAVTLVESTNPTHALQAEGMLAAVLEGRPQPPQPTFRLGIAGPPGAGKSTFIEALGCHLVDQGHRVAVLAVDPSSSRTGGSILGDKTRMTYLSRSPSAFVRPSPTSGMLGGIAQHTNEVVLLVEAAGFDVVLVETVGLGQSEVVVDEAVDMLALVVPPAGGDELQGVKRGIMEVVDLVVVNKADGALLPNARHSAADLRRALQLMRPKRKDWTPPVELCSSLSAEGPAEVWGRVEEFRATMEDRDEIAHKRQAQSEKWMWSQWERSLLRAASRQPEVQASADRLRVQLADGTVAPRTAARMLLDAVKL